MHTSSRLHISDSSTRARHGGLAALLILLVGTAVVAVACSSEPEPSEPEMAAETARVEGLDAKVEDLQNQLAEKEAALAELREARERLERQLPEPHSVSSGDSHWQISFRYLTEQRGVDPEEARRELARAALVDPIVEGFEIWNFYDGEHFGTFPTQDAADVSPGALARAQAEEAKQERTRLAMQVADLKRELTTERARLERRIAHMESRVAAKNDENASLRTYIDSLRQHHEALRSRIARLEEHLSSAHYIVGSRTRFREEGKVESSFLNLGGARLGDVKSEDFDRRIDLRKESSIQLQAEDFGVSHIEDVELLPDRWEENSDYRVSVSADGQSATLELLDTESFRLETIVILVSS